MGRVLEVCGRGVVAMDGVNVVKPPKYSAPKESGSREPVAARGFENGVWPSPGLHRRGDGADLRRGTWEPVRRSRRTGSVYDLDALRKRGIGHGTSALESLATGRCRARFVRAQIFVVDKGGATVSADRPGRRRFATMAQIESKHDVRRKVRDAQAQVNRERLKRESDNR